MLDGFRVLDLTTEFGFLCGKILGDLGADVIKIEKPGGDISRNIGPFYKNVAHPEKSLFWYAYNANKRGITLNIEAHDGVEIFKRLVKGADCIIESFPPGYMSKLGIGYSDLCSLNPRLILASISPFGQNGSYRDYKSSDMVAMAMSGFLYLNGDPDRAPVGLGLPHSYFFAAGDAAVGIMIAYYYRAISGRGQWVDVSLQQSAALTQFSAIPWWELNKRISQRNGPSRFIGLFGGFNARQTWPCKDGFVIFILSAGTFGAKTNRELTKWMDGEGMAPEVMKQMNWETLDAATMTAEFIHTYEEAAGNFFLTHTMKELYEGAVEREMQLYPCYDCKDIARDPQLKDRGFWVNMRPTESDEEITFPGPWVKMSAARCDIRRRAPLIGEHDQEIYEDDLGLSREQVIILKQSGVI
ncbi:CaiB/BaiF CoA transferase family protein [Chloroflexota bacterium]